jgi:DNA-directed RNA polymerase beta subunit
MFLVVPFVTDEMEYHRLMYKINSEIAQANAPLSEHSEFVRRRVSSRYLPASFFRQPTDIDYMDVAPLRLLASARH